MIRTSIGIEGVDDVIGTLRALPPRVAGKLVKPAMQDAGDLLKMQTHWQAYRQLQGAEQRGYKRKKPGPHLFTTAATRAKTYRSGNTAFVAVGFDYRKGGSHAHLVELGHRIVKGGTLAKGKSPGAITAAGRRALLAHGWDRAISKSGRRKRPVWVNVSTGRIMQSRDVWRQKWGQRLRGGGKVLGGKFLMSASGRGTTRRFPMLRPAFDIMKRPMLIAIENKLREIGPEAERLAKTTGK